MSVSYCTQWSRHNKRWFKVQSVDLARVAHEVDVSQNWEPFPEFGQYEGLSRIRNLPGLTL